MGYNSQYSGKQIDDALTIALGLENLANGWYKLSSSVESPISLNNLINPGNYTIAHWTEGPDFPEAFAGPLNIVITKIGTTIYQIVNYLALTYIRTYVDSAFTNWVLDRTDADILIGPTPDPNATKNSIWIDTSIAGSPIMKIHDGTSWVEITSSLVMKKSVYDTENKEMDIYKYAENTLAEMVGDLSKISAENMEWYQSNINVDTFNCAYYGNGIYVAGSGIGNGLYYSTDSQTWLQSNINSGTITEVQYHNNIWVATTTNGAYYSSDGKSWTKSNLDAGEFNTIAYHETKWVIGGTSIGAYYSTDAVTWTASNLVALAVSVTDVTYSNGMWGLVTSSNGIYYSTDAVTWTVSNVSVGSFTSITAIGSVWAAGSSAGIYYSNTGSEWSQSGLSTANVTKIATSKNKFVATTTSGIYYSTDANSWTISNINSGIFNEAVFANRVWFACSSVSGIYYSADGITWALSLSGNFNALTFGSSRWIAVSGDNNGIYYSSNVGMDVSSHMEDTSIHITDTERVTWNSKASQAYVDNAISTMQSAVLAYVSSQASNFSSETTSLLSTVSNYLSTLNDHINNTTIHPSLEKQAEWDTKADSDHTHNLDGRVTVSASNVTGTIPIERIDKSALERLEIVATEEARLALTKETVQNGDQVYVEESLRFYFVIDDTKLGTAEAESAFKNFAVGSSAMSWENIANKPTTIEGYGITDAYNKNQIDTKVSDINTQIDDINANITDLQDVASVDITETINKVSNMGSNEISQAFKDTNDALVALEAAINTTRSLI